MRSARLRGFPAERAACRRASSASLSSGTGAAGAAGASPRRGSSGGLAAEDCRPLRRSCSSSIPARMSSRSSLRKSAMKINSFYQFSKRLRNGFDWKVFCKYGTILEAVCKKSDGFCTGLCLYIARAGRILQEKPANSGSSCPCNLRAKAPAAGSVQWERADQWSCGRAQRGSPWRSGGPRRPRLRPAPGQRRAGCSSWAQRCARPSSE